MRILDIAPWFAHPARRGRAVRARNLLLALSERHDVRQFGRGQRTLLGRKPLLEEVPVTPMFRVVRCRYPFSLSAREWLVAHEPGEDRRERLVRRAGFPGRLAEMLEWSHIVLAEDPLELALARRERPDGRFVYVAHDVGLPASVSSAGRDLTGWAVETTELVVAVAPGDRDALLERYGLEPERVVLVANGVDAERFAPVDDERRAALRHELGLPADGPLVAVLASASEANLGALAWARRLAEAPAGLTFVVVGPVATPERRDRLVAVGEVPDVAPYLQAADLAVGLAERQSGSSVALLELLATGLPTIALPGAVRGTALAADRELLVTEPSEAALLALLEQLASDAALRARLGSAGRDYVVRNASWARSAAALEDALALLLDPAAARTALPAMRAAR